MRFDVIIHLNLDQKKQKAMRALGPACVEEEACRHHMPNTQYSCQRA
jgi:hypothetical protein